VTEALEKDKRFLKVHFDIMLYNKLGIKIELGIKFQNSTIT
jgi:hypothetical protein